MALLIKYSRIAAYTVPKIHERVLTRVCVRFSVKIALIIHRLIIRLHRSYMRARSSNDSANVINFHRGAPPSRLTESLGFLTGDVRTFVELLVTGRLEI